MAEGTVTVTEETYGTIKKIKFEWTSGDSGTDDYLARETTSSIYSGKILGLATVPGTNGDQPSDNYDIEIRDADSMDVLMGGGATRDDTNTEYVLSTSLGAVANDLLTFRVTNAGSENTGTAYLYIR